MAANATAVWRVRPSGNNNNGGGYDAGIASAGTDFSQQNAAQVTQSGGTVSTATVTLTDTGASFTSALIGNGIRVAGTGITTTYTFITAVPTGTTLTLQTSPGTTGTAVTYSIGGGWADFFTNTTVAAAILVPGNTVFILGSGTPNPSSYTFDYSVPAGGFIPALGDATNGFITWANDPATPGYKAYPDTTGGMPCVQGGNIFAYSSGTCGAKLIGLWFVNNGVNSSNSLVYSNQNGGVPDIIIGCVFDQFGNGGVFGANYVSWIGCEAFCSTGTTATGLNVMTTSTFALGCNIHDCFTAGAAIVLQGTIYSTAIAQNCIAAKTSTNGFRLVGGAGGNIINCTIDGNGGNGVRVDDAVALNASIVLNNIITNHIVAGKAGIALSTPSSGTIDDRLKELIDFNSYYNNTLNTSSTLSLGPHDTALGADPYVNSATQNYTLK